VELLALEKAATTGLRVIEALGLVADTSTTERAIQRLKSAIGAR